MALFEYSRCASTRQYNCTCVSHDALDASQARHARSAAARFRLFAANLPKSMPQTK